MLTNNSNMLLFVGKLPSTVTRKELRSFFSSALAPRWGMPLSLIGAGLIDHCEIIRLIDPLTDEVDHHGMVEIKPAKLALSAMSKLSGTDLHERPIDIHRYHHRSLRSPRYRGASGGADRGGGQERRRDRLIVELVH